MSRPACLWVDHQTHEQARVTCITAVARTATGIGARVVHAITRVIRGLTLIVNFAIGMLPLLFHEQTLPVRFAVLADVLWRVRVNSH